MQFIKYCKDFTLSQAAVYCGRMLDTTSPGISPGTKRPITGGVQADGNFRQLDARLAKAETQETSIASARLYLHNVVRDVAAVNQVSVGYCGSHPSSRRAHGLDLQAGIPVEASFLGKLSTEGTTGGS